MEKLKRNIPLYKHGLWSINDDPKKWFENYTHFSMRFNQYPLWKTLDPESRKNFWKKFSREAVQERANKLRKKKDAYRKTLKNQAKKANKKTRKKKAKVAASKFANEHKALVDFNKSLESKSDIQTGKWRQGSDEIYRPLLRQRTPNYDVEIPQIPGPPSIPPPSEPLPPVLPGPPPIPSGASKSVNPSFDEYTETKLERARRLYPVFREARERERRLEMLDKLTWNTYTNDFDLTHKQEQEASAVAQKANSDIPVTQKIERACMNAGKNIKKCGMRFMQVMQSVNNTNFGGKTRKKKRRRTKKTRRKRRRTKKRVGKSSKRRKTRKRK